MRAETKFTPGPWEARIAGYADDPEGYNIIGPNGVICGDEGLYMEAKHDAHLIAAAPELYAALEEMLLYCLWPTTYANRARAALAKARGEQ